MTVTITTDASFFHDHKMGGYACWIKSDVGLIKLSAAFKVMVETSTDAEFKAIINALHLIKLHGWKPTEIYINTDSKNVINTIEGTGKKLPDYAIRNLHVYKSIVKELNDPKMLPRHVKAHLHTRTPRHYCNSWCDAEARKAAVKKIFGK